MMARRSPRLAEEHVAKQPCAATPAGLWEETRWRTCSWSPGWHSWRLRRSGGSGENKPGGSSPA